MSLHRRRLLSLLGISATFGSLPGCTENEFPTDAVDAERLEFVSDDEFEVIEDFTDEATTGDRATLAVGANARVEITLVDGDERLRLDCWEGT